MLLLFDIGATKTRVAISTNGRRISTPYITRTPSRFSDGISMLQQVAQQLAHGKKIHTAAGGIASPIDRQRGTILSAPHLPGWRNKNLTAALRRIFKCPVLIENDAALAGLGEAVYGAGAGQSIVAYLTISTGIGGARIVDGRIDRSAYGFEPGHHILAVGVKGKPCKTCRIRGDFESLASGSAIKRKYNVHPEHITNRNIWDREARIIAYGLHNVMVFWSPDVIVLGGGVIAGQRKLVPAIRKYLQQISGIFPSVPMISVAKLGDSAGLYGACALIRAYVGTIKK